jgi:hypothetical protein
LTVSIGIKPGMSRLASRARRSPVCLDLRAARGHAGWMRLLASVTGLGRHPRCARRAPAVALAALAGALTLGAPLLTASRAAPLTLEGLTFSDELGGIQLEQGWGTGSLDDPFVLVEEITGDGPAILVVRGMTHRFGNRIRSHHDIGFALTKIVRNRTDEPWSMFTLELREFVDYPSPFGDGLSFGQASDVGRPFFADRFAENVETREPYDGVAFYGGVVEPGETVMLSLVITDTTPRWDFFLLQKRDSPLAHAPGPGERRAADPPLATAAAAGWPVRGGAEHGSLGGWPRRP